MIQIDFWQSTAVGLKEFDYFIEDEAFCILACIQILALLAFSAVGAVMDIIY